MGFGVGAARPPLSSDITLACQTPQAGSGLALGHDADFCSVVTSAHDYERSRGRV
jgi:hypothetical protein